MANANGIFFDNFEEGGPHRVTRDLSSLIGITGVEPVDNTVQVGITLRIPTSNVKLNFDPDATGAVTETQGFIPFEKHLGIVVPIGGDDSPTIELTQKGAVAEVVVRFFVEGGKIGGPGRAIKKEESAPKK